MHPAFSLIQLLDSLRDIKTIPDSSPNDSFMILKDCIADLPKVNKETDHTRVVIQSGNGSQSISSAGQMDNMEHSQFRISRNARKCYICFSHTVKTHL
jgi:hypothetical protein